MEPRATVPERTRRPQTIASRLHWLVIFLGVFGAGLPWCASASAEATEGTVAEASEQGVEFGQVPNVAVIGSTSVVLAYLSGPDWGGELLSLSSLTPSVCTLSESSPSRSIQTDVHAIALGVCSLSARGETWDAVPVEMQQSFNVVVARTPKVTWRVRAKETVGGKGTVELGSPARAGAELSSTTPAVCRLTSVSNNKLSAEITVANVRFSATGKCTIVAHVNGGGEYNAAQTQKSFKVSRQKHHRG
jgi:hypothetical protein